MAQEQAARMGEITISDGSDTRMVKFKRTFAPFGSRELRKLQAQNPDLTEAEIKKKFEKSNVVVLPVNQNNRFEKYIRQGFECVDESYLKNTAANHPAVEAQMRKELEADVRAQVEAEIRAELETERAKTQGKPMRRKKAVTADA